MSKILVTGGAGFIGSHLVDQLVLIGHEVTILDDFSTGRLSNLETVQQHVRILEGDIRNPDAVEEAMRGQEVVYHQAALGSVPRSVADPISSNAVNVVGTLNTLLAARDAGVRRFINASSSSVYGDTPTLPKTEGMTPKPQSPYALTKLAAEEYCRIFHRIYGLEAVSLRYFNVFGPRQRADSQYAAVIPKFIEAAKTGQEIQIYGNGEQTRDFTYVANNVEANILAANAPVEKVAGQVFNIACNEQISLLQLVERIAYLTQTKSTRKFNPTRPGDVTHSRADIVAAATAFNYIPKIHFDEGLSLTVAAFNALV